MRLGFQDFRGAVGPGSLTVRSAAALIVNAALAGLVADPIGARADELKVLPSVTVQAGVDTNPLLQVGNSKSIFIGTLSPTLKLLKRGDRVQYSLSTGADLRGYSGWDKDFTDSEQASLTASYLATERLQTGLNASVNRATILDALEDNTGKFTVPARLITTSVSPNAAFLLDPVDEIDFSGFFTDRSYNSPQLIDYQEYGGSIGFSRAMSETDKVSVSLTTRHSEPQLALATKTEIYSANLGWAHKVDVGLVATIGGGPVLIRRKSPAGFGNPPDQWGYQVNLSVSDPIDELTDLTIDFSHQALPTGAGGVGQRNVVHLGVLRKLTPVLTLNLDGHYTHSDAHGFDTDTLDTLYDARVGLAWQLNDVSNISLSYYHRQESFRTVSGRASSDGVFISLNRSFGRAQ